MKVLFFSNKCKFCSELITQLKDSEFSNEFKFINVDNNKVPDRIKVVPTIIDSEYKDLLEGKKHLNIFTIRNILIYQQIIFFYGRIKLFQNQK